MNHKYSNTNSPLSSEWVLERLKSGLTSSLQSVSFTVAFSGGVDSTVLLHLLVQLRNQGHINVLKAVHIHHGLSTFADEWAEYCTAICQEWDVPLTLSRVTLQSKGQGIEQAARDARYQVFIEAIGKDGVLLQGHHRDDQAETILMRLFRGTGVDGIQGIPEQRSLGGGLLFRPLLSVIRKSIEQYAAVYELEHINDDSNVDERFSRNFLRQTLIPQIEDRWPGASERIIEFADEVALLNEYPQEEVIQELGFCVEYHPEWLLDDLPLLSLQKLNQFPHELQSRIIRAWLKKQQVLLPSRNTLKRIFAEAVQAKVDAEPKVKVDAHFTLTRFQNCLALLDDRKELKSFEPFMWDWQTTPVVDLGQKKLYLSSAENTRLAIELPEQPLRVCRRCHVSEGSKIAISGRTGRKNLKRWFQEYKIPPWLREFVPLVYHGDCMVAAAGLWVCETSSNHGRTPRNLIWTELKSVSVA